MDLYSILQGVGLGTINLCNNQSSLLVCGGKDKTKSIKCLLSYLDYMLTFAGNNNPNSIHNEESLVFNPVRSASVIMHKRSQ